MPGAKSVEDRLDRVGENLDRLVQLLVGDDGVRREQIRSTFVRLNRPPCSMVLSFIPKVNLTGMETDRRDYMRWYVQIEMILLTAGLGMDDSLLDSASFQGFSARNSRRRENGR